MYKNQIPGGINLTKLELITKKRRVDLTGLFTELNLFEDIYSPTLSGMINILDTQGILQELPLEGAEKLSVEFNTPEVDETLKVRRIFTIYKITDRVVVTTHKQTYNLHFISEEAFIDAGMKVSKGYNGAAAAIANAILDDMGSKKNRYFNSSTNPISFAAPFWSPFKIISYYAANSINPQNKASNLLFYESVRGYNLQSLDDLYKKKPKWDFYYDNNPRRNQGKKDIKAEYSAVQEIHFYPHYDEFERIDAGMHENTSYIHDLTSKSLKVLRYQYRNTFSKGDITHLGAYPLVDVHTNNPRIVTHKNTMHLAFDKMPYDYSGYATNRRRPLLYDLELLRLDITVHGRVDLQVGDVVNLHMLRYSEVAGNEKNEDREDPYYSGAYIITAINHRITLNKHQLVIQISRNASSRKLHG